MSTIFEWAGKKVAENPVRAIKELPEHNQRVRWLKEDEEKVLRATILKLPKGEQRWMVVEVARNTGLRQTELKNLRWQDIDRVNGAIVLQKTKAGRTRHVPMNATVADVIDRISKSRGASAYVFQGARRFKWFKSAVEVAGIADFRWHDLRHDFASKLRMAGEDIANISDLLGHASIAQTMRYAHLSDPHLQAAVNKLKPAEGNTGGVVSIAKRKGA